jgi:hypothetical protein
MSVPAIGQRKTDGAATWAEVPPAAAAAAAAATPAGGPGMFAAARVWPRLLVWCGRHGRAGHHDHAVEHRD